MDLSATVNSFFPVNSQIQTIVYDPVHNVQYLYGSVPPSPGSCILVKYNIGTGEVKDLSTALNTAISGCTGITLGNSNMVYNPATREIYGGATDSAGDAGYYFRGIYRICHQ
jgi:hypothetical protein